MYIWLKTIFFPVYFTILLCLLTVRHRFGVHVLQNLVLLMLLHSISNCWLSKNLVRLIAFRFLVIAVPAPCQESSFSWNNTCRLSFLHWYNTISIISRSPHFANQASKFHLIYLSILYTYSKFSNALFYFQSIATPPLNRSYRSSTTRALLFSL